MAHRLIISVSAAALLIFGAQPAGAAPLGGLIDVTNLAAEDHGVSIKQEASTRKKKRRKRKRRRSAKPLPPPPGASSATAALKAKRAKAAGSNNLLFGTVETQSTNFKPFKKWRGAVAKMNKEKSDLAAFKKRFKKWIVFLDTLKGKDQLTQIKAVNKFMNQSKYIQDNKNWGVKDYWASPGEFLAKFGDCEDYSIAKYMALKYLGHDVNNMRIVALKDLNLKVGHAILVYYTKTRILVLDNQVKIVADSRKIRHYQPVYSINENHWWRHRVG